MGNRWWVLTAFTVLLSGAMAEDGADTPKEKPKSRGKILLFGGNGYIGGETATQLLTQGYELILTSRGKDWPWDLSETVWPYVKHLKCNRKKPNEECTEFWNYLEEEKPHFLAVIDFSAYKPSAVEPFYDSLRKRTDLYIYISSDSVYEVCDVDVSGGRLMMEDDAIRPSDPEHRERLAERDSYGNNKLRVEELLKANRQEKDGIPYVFLRLPDVIGERDTTDRVWKQLLWIEFCEELEVPIAIPSFTRHLKSSFVYVRDVGSAIRKILAINTGTRDSTPSMQKAKLLGPDAQDGKEVSSQSKQYFEIDPASRKKPIEDEIFNLASDYPKSLEELVYTFAEVIFKDQPKKLEKFRPNGEAYKSGGQYSFPSVTLGGIESSKLRDALDWDCSKWPEITKNIVNFYQEAVREFPWERDAVSGELMNELGLQKKDLRRRNRFLNALLSKSWREEDEL